MEDIGAIVVSIVCGIVGLLGLLFTRNGAERALLTRLFLSAFVIRIVFTFIFYKVGLSRILGGADDTIWESMWVRSRYWETTGPDSIWTVYNLDNIHTNAGWSYIGAWFYYIFNMESQMALAALNCFLSALVVVVIYKTSREFFEEKASRFVAWVAVFMPGFLIWSALTVKETWLMLFEITTFYAIWQLNRKRDISSLAFYGSLIFFLVAITLGFRFYVAGFLVVGILITLMCYRAKRPVRAAGIGLLASLLFYSFLGAANIIQFDLVSVTQTRFEELATFRENISDASQSGNESAIQFDFDTTTLGGAAMMLLVGSAYLLLSPFPWQIRSFGQMAALPDVLLWWWLVFLFIIPGIRYSWQRHRAIVLSITAFVLPLFLFYAFMFGNVGLAYRQRAQLMPFLLILAAGGYEKQLREKRRKNSLAANRHSRFKTQQTSTKPGFENHPESVRG